jgi:membrane protein implicated in regulation of membrane protease activity
MQSADPLAQLHDILLPPAISWWPLAWGWWLLLALLAGCAAFAIYIWRRRKKRARYRLLALQELALINERYRQQNDSAEYLQQLTILLRRTALSAQPRRFPVDIKGEAWLHWLDNYCPQARGEFTRGSGRVLLTGPYEARPVIDADALATLVRLWLQEHRNQWQKLPAAASPATPHPVQTTEVQQNA